MSYSGPAYFLIVAYWTITSLYGVLSSQAFVQEQFLAPGLVPPLAFFAKWHAAIGVALTAAWAATRLLTTGGRTIRGIAATIVSMLGVVAIAIVAPLAEALSTIASFGIVGTGVLAVIAISIADWRVPGQQAALPVPDRSIADLTACLMAAVASSATQTAAVTAIARTGFDPRAFAEGLRVHLILGGALFLGLCLIRAVAELSSSRRRHVEQSLIGTVLAAALSAYLFSIVFASISIGGAIGVAMATAIGVSLAMAVLARGGDSPNDGDGIADALASLRPRLTRHWWGFALWIVALALLASGFSYAARAGDWDFVLARTGAVLVWLLALSGAIAATRTIRQGGAVAAFAAAAVLLAAHLAMPATQTSTVAAMEPGARWMAEALRRDARPVANAGIVSLLHSRTNIPRSAQVDPVDISLAPLTGEPAAQRPHIFVFVVDSLRRDYLSPYNPKVTFTPSIDALAQDSLVFQNAFTQYGATGLSVPALWVGAPILHKQYVTPFAPMNSLAKLLEHERYTQWIGMDNIMDAILPASGIRDRLDHGVAVKDFRLCRTLTDIRSRLEAADDAPVFVYSLPQDLHVSVVAREGAGAIDERSYDGFYAPVASRLSRLDACLGSFVDDLKARGLYEQSIIVLTSDHGDSLGEDGRMGHAYSLHPEIVRVPLIVHVPGAMRSQWSWNEQRVAYTTDVTPTLYRLLGHETQAPAPFFGQSLAQPAGATGTAPRDRMVAASYGAVYGAVLDGGTKYYVFDAMAMRELAFSIGTGAEPGTAIDVTPDIQQRGLAVIRGTVDDISRFYKFPAAAKAE